MHEQSVIRALLEQVDAICKVHGARYVTEIRVEVGPLSGVEPLLLASAFEQRTPGGTAQGAQLLVDEVALLARCTSCEHEFEPSDFIFRCPRCGSNVRVLRGDDIQLVSVSMPTNELPQHEDSAEEAAT